jgi:hypothetical protein
MFRGSHLYTVINPIIAPTRLNTGGMKLMISLLNISICSIIVSASKNANPAEAVRTSKRFIEKFLNIVRP